MFVNVLNELLPTFSPSSLQMGSRFLQCPHHGAQNSIKTSLLSSLTMSLKVSPTTTCGTKGKKQNNKYFRNSTAYMSKVFVIVVEFTIQAVKSLKNCLQTNVELKTKGSQLVDNFENNWLLLPVLGHHMKVWVITNEILMI